MRRDENGINQGAEKRYHGLTGSLAKRVRFVRENCLQTYSDKSSTDRVPGVPEPFLSHVTPFRSLFGPFLVFF